MKSVIYIFLATFLSLYINFDLNAQKVENVPILTKSDSVDIVLPKDTLNISKDSSVFNSELKVKISKDAIKKEINYSATDSNWTSITLNQIRLYGSAEIEYEEIVLRGDSVTFDFDKNLAFAFVDKSKYINPEEVPKFESGETKAGYTKLAYNLKTKKAFINNIVTQEGEYFILGEKAKFVGKENDSLYNEDKFYSTNGFITTCNHPNPHFGVRTLKMKMIPNKIAIMGPSQIEIFGVPTPLILPFGFFPLIKGQSSGLIFPSSYDYNQDLGFGFRNIGYYFPINDNIDARVTGDIYTRGTHSINVASSYRKRYGYTGNISIGYANTIREDSEGNPESAKSFSIGLNHNQDSKAHPYRLIGGSINITTNQFRQRINNDANSVLNNTIRSSFNYNYRWPESPFKVSVGLDHNQNNLTREVNLTLPQATLFMNSINPFRQKNSGGEEKWFERVVVGYGASMRNFVKTTDTTLFTSATLKNMQSGFSHDASVSTNFRLLNYINISPSANYKEIYFIRTLQRELDPRISLDTVVLGLNNRGDRLTRLDTTYGTIQERFVTGIKPYRDANFSLSANTQLFLTKTFSRGFFRGFRHVAKPSVSFNYQPGTESRYLEVVNSDTRPEFNRPSTYNPFQGGLYSASLAQTSMNLSWSINHIFEGKYWSKKDTIAKNFKFFENIYTSGGYNFAADSLNWNDISVSGTTNIFRGLSNFQFNAQFTPYELENGSTRINKTLASQKKGVIQLVRLGGGFSTGLNFSQIRSLFKGKSLEEVRNDPARDRDRRNSRDFLGMFDNFRIGHNLAFEVSKNLTNKDTFRVSAHTIDFRGSIALTENWDLQVDNISYDINGKSFVYPSLSFRRNLHCWNMSFSWQPERGVYSFFIGVSSGAFNFLKYDYAQRNSNILFGG